MISLTAVALTVAACGTGDVGAEETSTTSPPATTTSTEADPTTTSTAAATTTTSVDAMEGVHVSETELGFILVDPDGLTLYVFTNDGEGESTCYDACAEAWPPVPADTPIDSGVDAAMFGSVERTDGLQQLTVNGQPLYLYAPDETPGDVMGQGLNGVWFVVDASGSMVTDAETGGTTTTSSDYGVDY